MRVALSGFESVWIEPQAFPSVFLEHVPSASEIAFDLSAEQVRELVSKLGGFDFWIIRLSGENPMDLVNRLKMSGAYGPYSRRRFRTAFWTMDSHHMLPHERRAAKHFDYVYVAHEAYLAEFPKDMASVLPCAFSLAPVSYDLIESVEENIEGLDQAYQVISPFRIYPRAKRNLQIFRVAREFDSRGISYFFGEITGEKSGVKTALIAAMKRSKVILNLTLGNDLNMRFFESLAVNRTVVANRVSGVELLEEYRKNLFLTDGETENVVNAVTAALKSVPHDYSTQVVSKHSASTRLSSVLGVRRSNLSFGGGNSLLARSAPGRAVRHRLSDLLGGSPLLSIRPPDLLHLFRKEGLSGLLRFLAKSLISYCVFIASRSSRRLSMLKVLFAQFCRASVVRNG